MLTPGSAPELLLCKNATDCGIKLGKLRKMLRFVAFSLNMKTVYSKYIDASAVSKDYSGGMNIGGSYAEIIPDYSSIPGTILSTSIVALGNDATYSSNNTLSKNTVLASIARNGAKITKVGVFSSDIQTVRVSIAVIYTKL